MPTKKQHLFQFAIARVGGLSFDLIDELAVEDADFFEKIVQNPALLAEEWARIFKKIQDFSRLEPLEKSLLFASHDLLERLPKMRATNPHLFLKKQRQTALGIYEYLARATAKTSPFAQLGSVQLLDLQEVTSDFSELDALFSNTRWADEPAFERTNLKLRHTTNVVLLERIFDHILQDKKFANQLEIRLNPGIFRAQNEDWIFPYFDNETEVFQVLENKPFLEKLHPFFQEKKQAALPHSLVLNWFLENAETDKKNAQLVVNQLVSIGFLEILMPISGHEPDWASRWLNRLAFLDSFEKQQDLATLHHWVNGTAKLLGWQNLEAARAAQIEANGRILHFFDGKNTISPENIWFQDSLTEYNLGVSISKIAEISSKIRAAIQKIDHFSKSIFLKQVEKFWWENFGKVEHETKIDDNQIDFLKFAHLFFQKNKEKKKDENDINEPFKNTKNDHFHLSKNEKLGVAFQPFRQKNGEIGAVVNSIFAGGGRLFGRFLPLFSEKTTESLRNWNQSTADEDCIAFYGQAFHNANLCPPIAELELDFHGARPRASAEKRLKLNEIGLRFDKKTNRLRAFSLKTGHFLRLIDVGLEAPDSRTPILQLLRALTQPPISAILSALENEKNLIFHRKKWSFLIENLPHRARLNAPEIDWLREILQFQKDHNLPRRCFFSTENRPQLLDFQSVISLRHFQKRIENNSATTVIFSEMLPEPTHLVAENRVCELVIEIEI